ncbi:MAG: hypothetical protein BJ554DRAFT_3127 [Olpidium bornovanus]|uniref:Uncharacterized protein n=1 Tax=Olpidium bornovanus TaxID=278681 RepID=A0A8H8A0Q9_9FUNG|nr:MAG: hypothetical protein BJ554DRAFT_3127 [Olpidium bornovanus]
MMAVSELGIATDAEPVEVAAQKPKAADTRPAAAAAVPAQQISAIKFGDTTRPASYLSTVAADFPDTAADRESRRAAAAAASGDARRNKQVRSKSGVGLGCGESGPASWESTSKRDYYAPQPPDAGERPGEPPTLQPPPPGAEKGARSRPDPWKKRAGSTWEDRYRNTASDLPIDRLHFPPCAKKTTTAEDYEDPKKLAAAGEQAAVADNLGPSSSAGPPKRSERLARLHLFSLDPASTIPLAPSNIPLGDREKEPIGESVAKLSFSRGAVTGGRREGPEAIAHYGRPKGASDEVMFGADSRGECAREGLVTEAAATYVALDIPPDVMIPGRQADPVGKPDALRSISHIRLGDPNEHDLDTVTRHDFTLGSRRPFGPHPRPRRNPLVGVDPASLGARGALQNTHRSTAAAAAAERPQSSSSAGSREPAARTGRESAGARAAAAAAAAAAAPTLGERLAQEAQRGMSHARMQASSVPFGDRKFDSYETTTSSYHRADFRTLAPPRADPAWRTRSHFTLGLRPEEEDRVAGWGEAGQRLARESPRAGGPVAAELSATAFPAAAHYTTTSSRTYRPHKPPPFVHRHDQHPTAQLLADANIEHDPISKAADLQRRSTTVTRACFAPPGPGAGPAAMAPHISTRSKDLITGSLRVPPWMGFPAREGFRGDRWGLKFEADAAGGTAKAAVGIDRALGDSVVFGDPDKERNHLTTYMKSYEPVAVASQS